MTDRRRTLTRRRVIQLFALTAINASTLAGCTGDDESTAETAENENGEITTDDMETHALTVSLVDQEDGSPIEGTVTVTNEAIGIQRFKTADAPSDEPGTVEIDLPPDEYGVYADTDQRAPRWASTTANVQLVGDQHVELAIYRPEERETLYVRSTDSVEVEVERTDDGFTLAKTVQEGVYEGLPYASGDREGSVQFALYPGEYLVRGTDVHGTTQEQRIVVDEGGKMELAELEPPEERREVPVTFRVLDVSDDSESTPVSHMIVKGRRYDSDNDESGEGTAFESPPTNRDGETTVDLAMGEQYIAWVETLQGSYIDPTRVHRSSKGVFRVRSPEMTLDVEIERS